MKFTDTHCHLYKEYYEDLDLIFNNAKNNHVIRYISDATNKDTCDEMIELANKYDDVYVAIGIHPEDLVDDYTFVEDYLKCNNEKIVAIGEIGLDYHFDKENRDKQMEMLDYQLSLAEKYNLPVVIHSREATKDTIDLLKKHNCRGVIHCFSGSLETAREYLKMGYYIGVGGVMTFKNSKINEVIKEIPLDRLLLETDSPCLTPEPHRGTTNEPKYIYDIALYLANLKGVSIEEISEITEINVSKLFSI